MLQSKRPALASISMDTRAQKVTRRGRPKISLPLRVAHFPFIPVLFRVSESYAYS